MKKINGWNLWKKNWENAKKFFSSKGNIKTRSRLKDKWYKDFEGGILELFEQGGKNDSKRR